MNKKIDNETEFKRTIIETMKKVNNKCDHLKNVADIVATELYETNARISNIILVLWVLFAMVSGIGITVYVLGSQYGN